MSEVEDSALRCSRGGDASFWLTGNGCLANWSPFGCRKRSSDEGRASDSAKSLQSSHKRRHANLQISARAKIHARALSAALQPATTVYYCYSKCDRASSPYRKTARRLNWKIKFLQLEDTDKKDADAQYTHTHTN